jgi:hypothetical protein
VVDFEERVVKEAVGWVDDSQRTVLPDAPPALSRRNLLSLRGRHSNPWWQPLLPEESVGLAEFALQLADDGSQLADAVT